MLNALGWGWECLGVLRLRSFTVKWGKDTREVYIETVKKLKKMVSKIQKVMRMKVS